MAAGPLAAVPVLALFGFAACLLFWFTGSLLPCVALHALNLLPFARERAPQAAA